MTDKEPPNVDTLVDYEPSDGEEEHNKSPRKEPENDSEAQQSQKSLGTPRPQSSGGSVPFKRIDASSVVVDKLGPKADRVHPSKHGVEAYRSAAQSADAASAGSKEPESSDEIRTESLMILIR